MSDAEDRSHSEEEVDDLFGDDGADVKSESTRPRVASGSDDDLEDNKDDVDGDMDDESEEEKEVKSIDVTLPRHALSHKPEKDTYQMKMPVFLNVEAHPFDPNEFKDKVAQNAADRSKSAMDATAVHSDSIAEKLLNENTIRWRYSNSGNDEIIKQSNAHFVQWSDGLMSLKIGKELFDFRELPLVDNYLAKSYVEHEILQNDSILNKSASLLPTSTLTDTHRKLTQAVKNIQKKDKILNTLTDDDPMLKQRMADENERKTLKMKRQMEQKRRLQEERMGKSESPAPGRGSYAPAYERFERTYAEDEYDDEDDFVANDDEEPEMEDGASDEDVEEQEAEFEKGAERLKNLKEEGQFKYDDAEDRRKRRRIIESDEDE